MVPRVPSRGLRPGTREPVDLGSAKQRVVLALLLLEGARLSTERLVDGVWKDDPPPSALASLQEAVEVDRMLGCRDVWARCPEEEGVPARWPIRQLVRALGGDPDTVLVPPPGADIDVQWADPTSARCLAFPAATSRDVRVALVLTLRDDEDTATYGRGSAAPRPSGRPARPEPDVRGNSSDEPGHRTHPQRDSVVPASWAVLRRRRTHPTAGPRPCQPPPPSGPGRRGDAAPRLTAATAP